MPPNLGSMIVHCTFVSAFRSTATGGAAPLHTRGPLHAHLSSSIQPAPRTLANVSPKICSYNSQSCILGPFRLPQRFQIGFSIEKPELQEVRAKGPVLSGHETTSVFTRRTDAF